MSADPFDQHGFDARIEWGPHGLRRLARTCEVVVIVDVLSFTTALDVALGRGATVLPYRFADDRQQEFAARHDALLAVGRRRTDAGHPYSLSPATLLALPAGSRLVLPSPNGSALAFGAAEAGARVVVVDVPLLTESRPARVGLAAIIVVDCPEDVAVARLAAERGMAEADARARMAAQASREERRAIAGCVVDNGGDRDQLEAEVARCWAWLEDLAAG
ncbi:MAG: dephospho-CoA kinase [Acidimicrobiia bacterium]